MRFVGHLARGGWKGEVKHSSLPHVLHAPNLV